MPPTGEREGALDLDELERLLGKGTPRPWLAQRLDAELHESMAEYVSRCIGMGGCRYFLTTGNHDDGWLADTCHTGNGRRSEANAHLIVSLVNNAPALLALARRALPEKQSPAAPAQPGEGELAEALRAVVTYWDADPDGQVDPELITRARALLERRGGKGLAGKGGGT